MHVALKVVLAIALLAVVSSSASAQNNPFSEFKIGPSKAAVIGAAVGLGAVTALVLYATLYKPSITGCVQSVDGASNIPDKDNLSYTLVDGTPGIKAGERVKLQGKKKKDKVGKLTFRVKKLKQDYGACQQ